MVSEIGIQKLKLHRIDFFLKQRQKLCLNRLIKEKFDRIKKRKTKITTTNYSSGIKLLKFFAPAAAHNLASFLIFVKITMDGACLLLKTLAFLSF
jgi:hypothetical protein